MAEDRKLVLGVKGYGDSDICSTCYRYICADPDCETGCCQPDLNNGICTHLQCCVEERKLVVVGFIDKDGKAVITKSSKCCESCTCKPTCKELIDGN